ncbi:hypothetical protein DSO57_1039541 [Entomophthora muscae]|uniref:Uncharacterized protein n=1 Tax=Entomophthora muscae TaxID=34485 RepID=A0ACC2RPB1_9FUNG|nr:hypothetical protein DSO57_1039541 [Entomophthora muscae]
MVGLTCQFAVPHPKPPNASTYDWLPDTSDEIKKGHTLTCLHSTFQEVVLYELPSIVTWEEMKHLLIEEFGGDLSLEMKKDRFMHITFKPKGSLAKFADRFYVKGQQLIPSKQLTVHEAYTACAQALKVNQLLHATAHTRVWLNSHRGGRPGKPCTKLVQS